MSTSTPGRPAAPGHGVKRAFRDGDRLQDRFTVLTFEGAGPLGERYLAFDEEIEVEVALRVPHATLLPDDLARNAFHRRMHRALAMSHSHLLRVYAVLSHEDRQMIAVQHAPGRSLDERLRGGERMDFDAARPLLGQVASALAHAHNLGVVLGDLRPSLVMTLSDGVKVTSLGVALALPRDRFLEALANDPELHCLAPELRTGQACDLRADVYSFAALVLRTLLGERGDAPSVAGAAAPLAPSPSSLDSSLPAEMTSVLERALDEDPARRHPTVEALLSAIDRTVWNAALQQKRVGPVTLPRGAHGRTIPYVRLHEAALEDDVSALAQVEGTEVQAVGRGDTITAAAGARDPQREVTRQVSEQELKRLAGEVSDILEVTRQVLSDEDSSSEAESWQGEGDGLFAGWQPGRSNESAGSADYAAVVDEAAFAESGESAELAGLAGSAARAESGRAARKKRPSLDESTRPLRRAPSASNASTQRSGIIEEDDDLEFDLDPATTPTPKVDDWTKVDLSILVAHAPPPGVPFEIGRLPEQPPHAEPRGSLVRSAPATTVMTSTTPTTSRAPLPPGTAARRGALAADPARDTTSAVGVRAPSAVGAVAHAGLHEADDPILLTDDVRRSGPMDAMGDVSGPGARTMIPEDLVDQLAEDLAGRLAEHLDEHLDEPVDEELDEQVEELLGDARTEVAPEMRRVGARPPGSAAPPPHSFEVPPAPPQLVRGTPDDPGTSPAAMPRSSAPPPRSSRRVLTVAAASVALVLIGLLWRSQADRSTTAATSTAAASAAALTSTEKAAPRAAMPAAAASAVAALPVVAATAACPAGMVAAGESGARYCVDAYEFPGVGQLPRVGLALADAASLCAARSARLCTSREWEWACRGVAGASYPYGQSYRADLCNTEGATFTATGARDRCQSRAGAFDMSGNASEWTAAGIVKGGGVGEDVRRARCSFEVRLGAHAPIERVGFRCCADAR